MGMEDFEIKGRVETIQTTALLRSVRILRRIMQSWDLLSLKFQWKTLNKIWSDKLSEKQNNNNHNNNYEFLIPALSVFIQRSLRDI